MSAQPEYNFAPTVSIGGVYIDSVLSTSISSTNSFSADTFSITASIGDSPPANLDFWTMLNSGYVEIYSGATSDYLITGMIDKLVLDVTSGIVKIQGRDLSSMLIDTSPQQDFINQTPAEIVTTIANQHGLSAVVTSVWGISGRFYGSNYTRLSLSKFAKMRSEWDVVVQLARECQTDVYVSARNLHFCAAPSCSAATAYLTPDLLSTLRVERTLWIPDTPTVEMSSWNSQDRALYSQSQGAAGGDTAYVFSGSNMTASQVTSEAMRYAAEIGRLRESLFVEMAWTETIAIRSFIYLYGTGSVLDGTYRVERLERRFSSSNGSKQSLVLSRTGG